MAKVFGMHMIGFRPGVKGEDFEKFFNEKVAPGGAFPGWKLYLLKGERGDREGKYLLMFEIESVESRNRMAPAPDQNAPDAPQPDAAMQAMMKEWETMATLPVAPGIYTDYVVVGETKS